MRPSRRTVLFYRDYRRFFGGHLKVKDYFDHTGSTNGFVPRVFLTASSIADNPWRNAPERVAVYDPEAADILFVAGTDWVALEPLEGIELQRPVINLIQSTNHADPRNPRFTFLKKRAIRVCVSPEVETAIRATGVCNGPIYTITNGVDFSLLPQSEKHTDVFIAGLKQRQIAIALSEKLTRAGYSVDCSVDPIERPEFVSRMAKARVAVTLPKIKEGFFLPALEALGMGCALVCPDCVGNRSFCLPEKTCLMPALDVDELGSAATRLLRDKSLQLHLRHTFNDLRYQFDIHLERRRFAELLRAI